MQSVLGIVAEMIGSYADARERQEESLAIYHKSGAVWGEANALLRLGNVAYTVGEFDEARKHYRESMALRKEIGSSRLAGRGEQAYVDLQECLQTFQEIGNQKGIGFAFTNLGNLAFAQEEYQESLNLYQQSFEICRGIGYQIGIAYAENHIRQAQRFLTKRYKKTSSPFTVRRFHSSTSKPSCVNQPVLFPQQGLLSPLRYWPDHFHFEPERAASHSLASQTCCDPSSLLP